MKASRTERGQSLIEFLISFVLLVLLLVGTFDFGYAFLYWITIRDAAQEGAIYASLHPNAACQSTLDSWVRQSSDSPIIDITDPTVTVITTTRAGTAVGDLITVEVQHTYNLHSAMIPEILGTTTIDLHADVTVSVLQPTTSCH